MVPQAAAASARAACLVLYGCFAQALQVFLEGMARGAHALVQGEHPAPGLVRGRSLLGPEERLGLTCNRSLVWFKVSQATCQGAVASLSRSKHALGMYNLLQAANRGCALRTADMRQEVEDQPPMANMQALEDVHASQVLRAKRALLVCRAANRHAAWQQLYLQRTWPT